MEKIKVNVTAALAKGAINVFKLADEKSHLMVICYDKGHFIVPIINKWAYVGIDDEKVAETIEQIVSAVIHERRFSDTNIIGAKVKYKTAPAHSMIIKSAVPTKGLRQYEGINKILEEAGYTFESGTAAAVVEPKDYSKLISSDPFAKAIYEENKKELKVNGATFESLNLETKIAYEGLSKGKYIGLIFAGPTGTGKSWAGRIIADKMGAPYLTLQIDRGTMVDTLVGAFVPKAGEKVKEEHAAKIIDIIRDPKLGVAEALQKVQDFLKLTGESSKWEFIPGPLLKAFSEGWIIILEEVNFGDPGVLAKLNEFTDGTLRVTINGIPYKRHPNFLVLMTMNPGYAGTDPLNVALKGRFAKVNVPQLTKDQFSERMICYSKGLGHALSKAFFDKLYDFAGRIEVLGGDTQYHEDVKFSVRNAQRLCDCILTKARTLDEFAAAIAIQYLNDLTMDNDNSEAVEKLKADPTTVNDIAALYDLYDYADIPVTKDLTDLASFYTVEDDGSAGDDDSELLDDSDLDSLMGGM